MDVYRIRLRHRIRFFSPLRSLSRVASDYSSGSVVCIGILRPLRPLREAIKIRAIFLHAEVAKSAEFLFPLVYHACAGGGANFVTPRVRKASAHPLTVNDYSFIRLIC